MDEIALWNMRRWQGLADMNALFTRPRLDMTVSAAQERVDEERIFGAVAGKKVLCLASGGGDQSAAFALLGATVTVVDLSPAQLERDRLAADHYKLTIETIQADMRDLSPLPHSTFDIVYQPHSLGFVPDCTAVFRQVKQVIRPGGIYFFAISNPFYAGLHESDWSGEGYTLKSPYVDGAEINIPDADWLYSGSERPAIQETREYRQTLSKMLNSLIDLGFLLMRVSDSKHLNPDIHDAPGSWGHRNAIAPAWLAFWLLYQPGLLPTTLPESTP